MYIFHTYILNKYIDFYIQLTGVMTAWVWKRSLIGCKAGLLWLMVAAKKKEIVFIKCDLMNTFISLFTSTKQRGTRAGLLWLIVAEKINFKSKIILQLKSKLEVIWPFWHMETCRHMLSLLETLWPETFWLETVWVDTVQMRILTHTYFLIYLRLKCPRISAVYFFNKSNIQRKLDQFKSLLDTRVH